MVLDASGLEINSVYTLPIVDGSSGQYLQTNGSGTVSWAYALPSGTVMLFGQSAAPTSWTKKTDWTDQSMIVYTTGNIAQGGSVDAKAAHTHTGPSHTHTGPGHTHTGPGHTHTGPSHTHIGGGHVLTTAEMPAHTHTQYGDLGLGTEPGGNNFRDGNGNTWTVNSSSTGGGGSHSHGTTSAGGTGATGSEGTGNTSTGGTGATGSNSAPLYCSVIAATKD